MFDAKERSTSRPSRSVTRHFEPGDGKSRVIPLSIATSIVVIRSGTQKSPALAMNATGRFAAAWHSDTTGNWSIYARTGTMNPMSPSQPPACPRPSEGAKSRK
jgi:hypothetical protein